MKIFLSYEKEESFRVNQKHAVLEKKSFQVKNATYRRNILCLHAVSRKKSLKMRGRLKERKKKKTINANLVHLYLSAFWGDTKKIT